MPEVTQEQFGVALAKLEAQSCDMRTHFSAKTAGKLATTIRARLAQVLMERDISRRVLSARSVGTH